jgi:hypothetical protein
VRGSLGPSGGGAGAGGRRGAVAMGALGIEHARRECGADATGCGDAGAGSVLWPVSARALRTGALGWACGAERKRWGSAERCGAGALGQCGRACSAETEPSDGSSSIRRPGASASQDIWVVACPVSHCHRMKRTKVYRERKLNPSDAWKSGHFEPMDPASLQKSLGGLQSPSDVKALNRTTRLPYQIQFLGGKLVQIVSTETQVHIQSLICCHNLTTATTSRYGLMVSPFFYAALLHLSYAEAFIPAR